MVEWNGGSDAVPLETTLDRSESTAGEHRLMRPSCGPTGADAAGMKPLNGHLAGSGGSLYRSWIPSARMTPSTLSKYNGRVPFNCRRMDSLLRPHCCAT